MTYAIHEQVPGVAVVGFAGGLPTATPACRSAVLSKGDTRCIPRRLGEAFEVDVSNGTLHVTVSTPIKRFPARMGWDFLIVSEEEHSLLKKALLPTNIFGIVGALSGTSLPKGNVALYCSAEASNFFVGVIAKHVKKLLVTSLREQDSERIHHTAWWLSRSAIKDTDVSAASAALDHVGDRKGASTVMDAFFHSQSKDRRARLFLNSRNWIDRVTR